MKFLTGVAIGFAVTAMFPVVGAAFLFGVLVTIAVRIA